MFSKQKKQKNKAKKNIISSAFGVFILHPSLFAVSTPLEMNRTKWGDELEFEIFFLKC